MNDVPYTPFRMPDHEHYFRTIAATEAREAAEAELALMLARYKGNDPLESMVPVAWAALTILAVILTTTILMVVK